MSTPRVEPHPPYTNADIYVIEQKYDGHVRRHYDSSARADVFGLVGTIRQRNPLTPTLRNKLSRISEVG